jgi:hypothetical protein
LADSKKKPAARPVAGKPVRRPSHLTPKTQVRPDPTQTAVTEPATVMPTLSSTEAGGSASTHASMTAPSRRGWMVIGGTIVGLLVVFLAVFAILIYKYNSDSRIVQIVADIVPYPAERVNGRLVSYSDYLFEVNSIKHYYLSQTDASGKPAIDFTTADGKKKLQQLQAQELQQLQQEAIVEQLASKYKVSVSNSDVQAQVSQITKSAGGTAKVKDVLNKYYGWSISDLEKKIRQQLLEQKVSTAVTSDPVLNAAAKAKAAGILTQVKAGGDFATLAKKYSQDSSAANGGDLGYFTRDQMVQPIANAAFSLQAGQVYSSVVQSQYGYSIIKVNAVKGGQVDASQILIKNIDFNTYLQQQVSKASIQQYIHP